MPQLTRHQARHSVEHTSNSLHIHNWWPQQTCYEVFQFHTHKITVKQFACLLLAPYASFWGSCLYFKYAVHRFNPSHHRRRSHLQDSSWGGRGGGGGWWGCCWCTGAAAAALSFAIWTRLNQFNDIIDPNASSGLLYFQTTVLCSRLQTTCSGMQSALSPILEPSQAELGPHSYQDDPVHTASPELSLEIFTGVNGPGKMQAAKR